MARYLIAEDDVPLAHFLRRSLQPNKYDIRLAHDGEAALKEVSTSAYRLLILDLNLPKKHGYDVLEHMRRSARCSETPVVVVSTSDSARDRARVAGLGVSRYLRKPSEYADLLTLRDAVKDALET